MEGDLLIGHLIKEYRIRSNIKQSVLCKGICSTSYLSKIENGQVIPSEEITKLLLKRLKIDEYIRYNSELEIKVINDLSNAYIKCINERDTEEIKQIMKNNEMIVFNSITNMIYSKLFQLRFKMMVDSAEGEIETLIKVLEGLEGNFNDKQRFLFRVNMGIYYILKELSNDAKESLNIALSILRTLSINEIELADFNNILSLSFFNSKDYRSSILFAQKSLNFHLHNLNLRRAIDCYIVIGNSYKKMNEYEHAKNNLLNALKLTDQINIDDYKGMIYQNLGALHSNRHSEIAIEYFLKSYEVKIMYPAKNSLFKSIYSLIKEYRIINDFNNTIKWSNIGLNILNKEGIHEHNEYYFHFNIALALTKNDNKVDKLLVRASDYFYRNGKMDEASSYLEKLADFYYSKRNYKKAAVNYRAVIEINNILKEGESHL